MYFVFIKVKNRVGFVSDVKFFIGVVVDKIGIFVNDLWILIIVILKYRFFLLIVLYVVC